MNKLALLVYDISLIDGAERVAINLAYEFAKYYKVFIISLFCKYNIPFDLKEKCCIYIVSSIEKSISFNFLFLTHKVYKYLKTNKVDLIISITAGVVTIADFAAIMLSTKVIYAEHSNLENKTYGKKHQLRQYIGAKLSDYVVTLTERDRKNFIDKFKLPDDKIVSISNWYSGEKETKEQYNSKVKRIISVGRLEKVKGYDLLLKVADEIKNKYPDWTWDIYGDGSLYTYLKREIKKKKLDKFIFLKGNVNNIDKYYKNYSFLVMTSLYEGFPMTLLEAQNAKLPIVCFDCPTGPAEIVEHGVNGFLIPSYDINIMVTQIEKLINNERLRIQYSDHADQNLIRYKKNIILDKWLNVFQKLME